LDGAERGAISCPNAISFFFICFYCGIRDRVEGVWEDVGELTEKKPPKKREKVDTTFFHY
jgi:hypothetical protein